MNRSQLHLVSAIDRAHARAAQEARQASLRGQAERAIKIALELCPHGSRAYLSVALLNSAAEAVAEHHDGPRAQAALGQAAAKHGAEIPKTPQARRAAAEKLFRREG